MKKSIVLMVCMFLLVTCAFAQRKGKTTKAPPKPTVDYTVFNTLVPLYVSASEEGKDAMSPLTGIVMDYLKLDDKSKEAYRREVISRGDKFLDESRYDRAIAMAKLYSAFNYEGPETYGKLSLAFYNAHKAVFELDDSIILKKEIEYINSLSPMATEKDMYQHRVSILNDYLRQMREYIPPHNRNEGVWISDLLQSDGYPSLIIDITNPGNVHNGVPEYRIRTGSVLDSDFSGVMKDSTLISQDIISYNGDSIYCVWASSSMKSPNQELGMLARSTGMSVSNMLQYKISANLGANFAANLTAGVMGGLMDAAVNGIMDAVFNPEKKTVLMQMKLHRRNNRQLEADIYFSGLKVKEGSQPIQVNHKIRTILTKVEPEDSLFFLYYGKVVNVTGTDKLKQKDLVKEGTLSSMLGSSVLAAEEQTNFNKTQMLKQLYFTEKRLHEENEYNLSKYCSLYRNASVWPVVGLLPHKKKTTSTSGFIIDKPIKGLPAYMSGLKKGDVITHLNGFSVKNCDEFIAIMKRSDPYEDVVINVLRGKKELCVKTKSVIFFQRTKKNE